jgi:hypothetical protein
MPAQLIDGKIVANVSHREKEIDDALASLEAVTGKDVENLSLGEIKALLIFLLARMNLLDEYNQIVPTGRPGKDKPPKARPKPLNRWMKRAQI